MKEGGVEGGFLLLEVMIALTILSTGLLTALYAFSASTVNTGVVQREQTAHMLARQHMEETLQDRLLSPTEDQGKFEPDHPAFSWARRVEVVQEFQGLRLMEIRVEVNWRGRGQTQSYALDTRVIRRKPTVAPGPSQ